jgi:hypothetical protein
MDTKTDNHIFTDLKSGKLENLAERVRQDDTLLLALRSSSLDIYYRGGRILHLTEQPNRSYKVEFDKNYNKDDRVTLPGLRIGTASECDDWIRCLPALKELMNTHFARNRKSEREFQQLVAWENTRSSIAKDTEYFITDIEHARADRNTRIDMLGVKWLSGDRKVNDRCKPVFIEMKYGINAYDGKSGIDAHIQQLERLLRNETKKQRLSELIADQFSQLVALGLTNVSQNAAIKDAISKGNLAKFVASGKPEVILLLANHNPRSTKLLKTIKDIKEPSGFDLRFFHASFAGYGMHDASMLTREQFIKHLEIWSTNKKRPSP